MLIIKVGIEFALLCSKSREYIIKVSVQVNCDKPTVLEQCNLSDLKTETLMH